jgi:hypothetical protein
VLCSDVVWVEYLVPHLVKTMAGKIKEPMVKVLQMGTEFIVVETVFFLLELSLTPDGFILLAHQTRSLRIDGILFECICKQGFMFTQIEKCELHPDFTKDDVCIWKIYRTLCHT